ncbi:hypothetical protein PLESTM_000086500 [Pleodorina starrii]|nr:hypothetical protein PLESTM_000086500 [Pleodorina starrii]
MDACAAPSPAGQKAAAVEPSSGSWFTESEVVEYRRELLNWYDHNHRVLPWRRTPHSKKASSAAADASVGAGTAAGGGGEEAVGPAPAELPQQQFAYWVWVSEVMLQQTQVATVIPYFKRWVAKWPSVADLAAADIDTVNGLWAGLGYYRRAKYLLDGARYVVEKLDGKFPTTAPELLKIPGVGPYTSAAVASIAFGSPAAAVDGNVIRVVSRLRALPGDPTKLAATHTVMASELLDRQRPGCYNQALMELGATVCRPVNPDCAGCPARGVCRAAAEWQAYLEAGGAPDVEDAPRVTQYPGRKAVKEKREQSVAVTVLEVICTNQAPAGGGGGAPGGGGGTSASGKKPASAPADGTPAAQPAAAAQPPRKRQRTMQDFALAAAARKQQQQQQQQPEEQQQQQTDKGEAAAASAGGGGGGATPGPAAQGSQLGGVGGGVDLEALVARGARHYLLTMRPQGGLLAGLWEFPGEDEGEGEGEGFAGEGAVLQADAANGDDAEEAEEEQEQQGAAAPKPAAAATSALERQRLSDSLLRRLLGPKVALSSSAAAAPPPPVAAGTPAAGAAAAAAAAAECAGGGAPRQTLRVLARHEMGQYIHVFSHIRQTNYVQRVTAVFHGDLAALEQLTGAGAAGAAGPAGIASAAAPSVATAGTGTAAASEAEPASGAGSKAEALGSGADADESEEEEVVEAADRRKGQQQRAAASAKRGQVRGKAAAPAGARGKKQPGGEAAEKAEGASGPAVMWVSRQQIEGPGLGLSSGVRKIFQQAVGGSEGAGGAGRGRAAAGATKGGAAGKAKGGAAGKARGTEAKAGGGGTGA